MSINSGPHKKNYPPIIPTIYRLPKTHKDDIPLHPIISGIGTATHNLAKSIAKILLLGTIISTYLKNFTDLLSKIQNINMENKLTTSHDIQSLYINIPVKKCIQQLKFH